MDAQLPFHMKEGFNLVSESAEAVEVTRWPLIESICQTADGVRNFYCNGYPLEMRHLVFNWVHRI